MERLFLLAETCLRVDRKQAFPPEIEPACHQRSAFCCCTISSLISLSLSLLTLDYLLGRQNSVYFMAGLNTPLGGGMKLARFLGTLLVQAHGEKG